VAALVASLMTTHYSNHEIFDRLLRQAVTSCWVERFKKEAAKGARKVNQHGIGETAGTIWETLSREGPLSFAVLMEEVNAPQSLFFMAIGWLSREEKLQFEQANGDYLIRLT
jgi:winged helix-turn-helix protein DUF2582